MQDVFDQRHAKLSAAQMRREDQKRISNYLRRGVRDEERVSAAYELDPYSRVVYGRLRELYWTLSRLVPKRRAATALGAGPGGVAFSTTVTPQTLTPRIFIDATDSLAGGKATGIQRVVREISRHAGEGGLALPVMIRDGRLVAAVGGSAVDCQPGDILLLLDSGWNRLDDYPPVIEAFRARGGKVVGCLYDLFPILYPTLYTRGLVADFHAWIDVLLDCDAVVAISRSVAESFASHVREMDGAARPGMGLGWWPLGSDFPAQTGAEPGIDVQALAALGPFFLGVGTLEMRKGYPVAVDAFERLWAKGVDANFVIAGRAGWNAAAFEARLRRHPQKGRRLFWLDDASDADLQHLYRNARGVVLSTFAEGFGLPLVEAAQYGAPVIASDIPVFREVGGAGVRYFDVLDPASLAAQVEETLASGGAPGEVPTYSWGESTAALMSMLRAGSWQATLG